MVKKKVPKSTQKTVTIDQELWNELESWLSSKQAKKLGYHSKAQFAPEAVRELLERYTSGRNIEQEILDSIERLETGILEYNPSKKPARLSVLTNSGRLHVPRSSKVYFSTKKTKN